MAALITDDMLEQFAVVGRWDELADGLLARYGGVANRLIVYTAAESSPTTRRRSGGGPRWPAP